jgi:hypothetical protein
MALFFPDASMSRSLYACLVLLLLPACAMPPGWPPSAGLVPSQSQLPAPAASAFYNFDWRLSGNRAVAPLQVFDDGRRTWLQFPAGQAVPAIFARTQSGDQLLSYAQEGAYLVLGGVWPVLRMRGGHLQSVAERMPDSMAAGEGSAAAGLPSVAVGMAAADNMPAAPAEYLTAAASGNAAGAVATGSDALPASMPSYEVSPADINIRQALARWAGLAGWLFEPEHWSVDVDIPLAGSASFDADFKSAVQRLVAATEMGDRPLQPCFYSNKVLRIVPLAQPCDRAASTGRTS